ncbi:MAG: HD-GYP domain-containing protein [Treponema sp.]|jgi:HD-GYP domain-containing protein (c-di-GMP phosphodiesterase class II)|nr:HD-GYP domain-containing protein [Treponema sp.]
MKDYLLDDIPPGSYFSEPVYLDSRFILVTPEIPFSSDLNQCLVDWEFREVHSEGEPSENFAAEHLASVDETELVDTTSLATVSDAEKIKRAETFYASFYRYAESIFTRLAIKDELDIKAISERVKNACDMVREDRRFLMRVLKNAEIPSDQNYLISHSVRSTIIAIIIGTYLKLPAHRLIELGVAALLHEIGMIQLPPQVYLSNRALNPQEKKAILTHPILSFNLLKSFDFPLVISLAALEHHERENGTGYPQKLTSEKISFYAKIIAVACSYEALSTNRPHKEAKDGYTGMLELLKNEGKQYDDTVVRALVFSLSIYPIGLYVLLSSGKKGQVVDVNPENPRYPIVQIFGELTPDGKNKTLETSPDGISIVRPLTRDEIAN